MCEYIIYCLSINHKNCYLSLHWLYSIILLVYSMLCLCIYGISAVVLMYIPNLFTPNLWGLSLRVLTTTSPWTTQAATLYGRKGAVGSNHIVCTQAMWSAGAPHLDLGQVLLLLPVYTVVIKGKGIVIDLWFSYIMIMSGGLAWGCPSSKALAGYSW